MKLRYLLLAALVIGMMATGFVSAQITSDTQIGGGVGYYDITSSPSDATVIFDGSNKGTTPVTIDVSTSGTPGHTLSCFQSRV